MAKPTSSLPRAPTGPAAIPSPTRLPTGVVSIPAGLKASPAAKAPAPKTPPTLAPVEAPAASPAPGAGPRFGVAVIAGPGRGQRFRLPTAGAGVGRQRGGILFPEDACISPQHASLVVRGGRLHVRDESSTSGVFLSITGEEPVPVNGSFIAGQRLFRYTGPLGSPEATAEGKPQAHGAPVDSSKPAHRVEEVLIGGRVGRAVVSERPNLTIGQGSCDLSFPKEEGLAAVHCELKLSPAGAVLLDRSEGLGTFVRVQPGIERPLNPGDRLRIGQQTLLVELMSG